VEWVVDTLDEARWKATIHSIPAELQQPKCALIISSEASNIVVLIVEMPRTLGIVIQQISNKIQLIGSICARELGDTWKYNPPLYSKLNAVQAKHKAFSQRLTPWPQCSCDGTAVRTRPVCVLCMCSTSALHGHNATFEYPSCNCHRDTFLANACPVFCAHVQGRWRLFR